MTSNKEINQLYTEFKQCQKTLTALGDEVRQHIILEMMSFPHDCGGECKGLRVGEIASKTNLSRPAVSHHIQILKNAGILKMRREGTKNYYYFDTDVLAIDQLISMLNHTKKIMATLPDRSGEND